VTGTAGSESFKALRADLAADYRLESSIPEISVVRYSRDTDRKLVLHHQSYDGKVLLKAQAEQTLKQVRLLWGFEVSLETIDRDGNTVRTY
jgi:stage V sporulation protein R